MFSRYTSDVTASIRVEHEEAGDDGGVHTWNIHLKLGSGRAQARTRYGRVISPGTGWFEGQGACRYAESSHTRMICAVEGKHAIVGSH
jgi:hypothetical protein